ncbi:MAG TPA: hypothetical protein VGI39_12365 [Polyangiaceae bacterium]|jgi:hypothetical protein
MKHLILSALSVLTLSAAASGCAVDASSASPSDVASESSALSGGVMSLASTNLGCNTQASLNFQGEVYPTQPGTFEVYALSMLEPPLSTGCALRASLRVPAHHQLQLAAVKYQGNAFVSQGTGTVAVSASLETAGSVTASQFVGTGSTALNQEVFSQATTACVTETDVVRGIQQSVFIQPQIPSNVFTNVSNLTVFFYVKSC